MENQSQIEKITPIESTPPLQKLPNATTTLVLGICSIVGCCCCLMYIPAGLICGIIALIISAKDEKLLKENPDGYSDAGNHKAGRICAWIGISIFVATLLITIISYIFYGVAQFSEYNTPYYY